MTHLPTLLFRLKPNEDPALTCLICYPTNQRPCEFVFTVRGSSSTLGIGCHAQCAEAAAKRNQELDDQLLQAATSVAWLADPFKESRREDSPALYNALLDLRRVLGLGQDNATPAPVTTREGMLENGLRAVLAHMNRQGAAGRDPEWTFEQEQKVRALVGMELPNLDDTDPSQTTILRATQSNEDDFGACESCQVPKGQMHLVGCVEHGLCGGQGCSDCYGGRSMVGEKERF